MRPIKLEIKGLNSFIEKQTIDFDKLTKRGLFGIFGPTGSGKSTILDGITLALYGEVSRKSSNYINMINTFPMSDDLGKNLSGEGEYFEFNISSRLNSKKINELTYEISLTPSVSSLDTKYVKVYLEENGEFVCESDAT